MLYLYSAVFYGIPVHLYLDVKQQRYLYPLFFFQEQAQKIKKEDP